MPNTRRQASLEPGVTASATAAGARRTGRVGGMGRMARHNTSIFGQVGWPDFPETRKRSVRIAALQVAARDSLRSCHDRVLCCERRPSVSRAWIGVNVLSDALWLRRGLNQAVSATGSRLAVQESVLRRAMGHGNDTGDIDAHMDPWTDALPALISSTVLKPEGLNEPQPRCSRSLEPAWPRACQRIFPLGSTGQRQNRN